MMVSRPRMTAPAASETKKHTITPPTSDRVDRTSFSSIKENHTGVAQSFTDSKVSSFLRHEFELSGTEQAIVDDASSGTVTPPIETAEGGEIRMLHPESALHGFICPCDGFRGWKTISLGGKPASKSFGDLRSLARRWEWDATIDKIPEKTAPDVDESLDLKKVDGRYPAGQSPFERLPVELLGEFTLLYRLYSYGNYARFMSCMEPPTAKNPRVPLPSND